MFTLQKALPRGYVLDKIVTCEGRYGAPTPTHLSSKPVVLAGEIRLMIEYDDQGPFIMLAAPLPYDYHVLMDGIIVTAVAKPEKTFKLHELREQGKSLDKYFVMESPTCVRLVVKGEVVARFDAALY